MLTMIKTLARLTWSNPREAAALLLRQNLGQGMLMQLATVVVALGVISTWAYSAVAPAPGNSLIDGLLANPVLLAIVQFMALMLSVLAIFLVGRMFGGRGGFEQTLLLSIWLQFYMLVIQTGLIGGAVLAGNIAAILDTAAFLYMLWLLVNFIAVLHGFTSLWRVFAGLVAASFLASFVIILVLGMVGIGAKGY